MQGIPNTLPSRISLGHTGTPGAVWRDGVPVFFLTVCAENRVTDPLLATAPSILDSARFYHKQGKWFLRLLLVMPDHIHLLVSFPGNASMATTIGNWKRYLTCHEDIVWQPNFFDHRIRDAAELTEKWDYILNNPVRKGLVDAVSQWQHRLAFDPSTGAEIANPMPFIG